MLTRIVLQIIAIAAVALAVAPADADAQSRKGRTSESSFRDCSSCPLMMPVPAGSFMMGSPDTEPLRVSDEGPQRQVSIPAFAISKYEVTFSEWDACVAKGGCSHKPSDEGWGRNKNPVLGISYDDAQQFVAWLASTTGKPYRLPTEAEWEYAARGVTNANEPSQPFSTGQTITYKQANFDANFVYGPGRMGIYRQKTMSVGSLSRNAFGLHDMHGNVWEWVADCYRPTYQNAPVDGSAVTLPNCRFRVLRGGAWNYYPWMLRSAYRYATPGGVRLNNAGLRVALTVPPVEPPPLPSQANR
ncbi:MAG: formylglycine-generating enzyme family protein [Hyphomicrobiaceae bacterium]